MDFSTTLNEIQSWPVDDQLELVQQVWDQIADSGKLPPLSDEQMAELDRRAAALDADPSSAVTWEDIVRHVKREP